MKRDLGTNMTVIKGKQGVPHWVQTTPTLRCNFGRGTYPLWREVICWGVCAIQTCHLRVRSIEKETNHPHCNVSASPQGRSGGAYSLRAPGTCPWLHAEPFAATLRDHFCQLTSCQSDPDCILGAMNHTGGGGVASPYPWPLPPVKLCCDDPQPLPWQLAAGSHCHCWDFVVHLRDDEAENVLRSWLQVVLGSTSSLSSNW